MQLSRPTIKMFETQRRDVNTDELTSLHDQLRFFSDTILCKKQQAIEIE